MKRIVLFAFGLTLALPAAPCWACSCITEEPKDHAENADVIFTGVVRSLEARSEPDPSFPEGGNLPVFVATFDSETAYKGTVSSTMEIRTATDSAACGITLTEGVRYTVFAYRSGANLHTGLCSGTTDGSIDAGTYGLSASTPSGPPADPSPATSDTDPARWTWALIAPAALVTALLLWVLVARSQRRSAAS